MANDLDAGIAIYQSCGSSTVPHGCPQVELEATSAPSLTGMMQKGKRLSTTAHWRVPLHSSRIHTISRLQKNKRRPSLRRRKRMKKKSFPPIQTNHDRSLLLLRINARTCSLAQTN